MFPFSSDDENQNEIKDEDCEDGGDNMEMGIQDVQSYEDLLSVEEFFVGQNESPQGKAFILATKFAQIRAANCQPAFPPAEEEQSDKVVMEREIESPPRNVVRDKDLKEDDFEFFFGVQQMQQ